MESEGLHTIPDKPYFRIGEVAKLAEVEPYVLRYWEREFPAIRPSKSAKGQRVYTRRHVESILRIRHLLHKEGFTIAGAKKRFYKHEPNEAMGAEESPEPHSEEESRQPSLWPDPIHRSRWLSLRNEVEAHLRAIELL